MPDVFNALSGEPMIKVGEKAPDFELDSQFGTFSLSQFKGRKNVMLVFYPLDFTPN